MRAEAEARLGDELLGRGELARASEVLTQAAAELRRLGDGVGEARVSLSLGRAWRNLGRPDRALAAYRRALVLYRAAGNAQGEASAVSGVGLILLSTGDLQGALVQFQTALDQCRRLGLPSFESPALENLGSVYSLIGHDEEALDLLRQALRLAGNDPKARLSPLIALAWAEYLAGRPESALKRYEEALVLAERVGDRLRRASILDRRASALRALHRKSEAAKSYEQALAASRAAGSKISEGHTLANLGWLDLKTGAPARALPRLRQSRELLAAAGDPNGEVYALVGSSRAERLLGDVAAARRHAEAAVRLVEGLRSGLRGSLDRGSFLATRYDAYEELVTLLMDLDRREPAKGHDREALQVAERARARNLAEEIGGSPSPVKERGPGGEASKPRTVRHHDVLKTPATEGVGGGRPEISALEERRRAMANRDPRDPRLPALDAALRARSLEADRLAAAAVPPPAFASLREIQALADADTLLVYYLLAEPASFAWTVDRSSIVAHRLPGKERIERLARRVVAALPHSHEPASRQAAARAARELSAAVLAPLAGRLAGRRRLVVLPDGALHLVPFGALPAPALGSIQPEEPLLVRHEIAVLSSATVLRSQRRRLAARPPAPATAGILADPVFSRDDDRLPGGRSSLRNAAQERSEEGMDLEPLRRLKHTAEEAEALRRLVPRESLLLAMGPAARRDLVLSGALRRYRILHFATHGLLDPVLPERSGIVLSRFDERGRRLDGFLSAPDVADLDLPAELAVLSACETALGRELRGEGLVGLTQAFFRAGVRGVVVGYWSVDDRATAALMARFYRGLLVDRLPPSAALRAAQLAIRREKAWQSPYYWAGFAFHGDWRTEVTLKK